MHVAGATHTLSSQVFHPVRYLAAKMAQAKCSWFQIVFQRPSRPIHLNVSHTLSTMTMEIAEQIAKGAQFQNHFARSYEVDRKHGEVLSTVAVGVQNAICENMLH